MIFLALSIIASTLIFVIFRLFASYNINTLQAIVVNYFVACSCGVIGYQNSIELSAIPQYNWFYYTLALGALFIIVFNLMAITTQHNGLSVVSVATKMALVIPIAFGLWYYKEPLGTSKAAGIVLALIAVYLVAVKKDSSIILQKKNLVFPVLVFLGSGLIDTSLNFLQNDFITDKSLIPLFSSTIFLTAGVIGIMVLVAQKIKGVLVLEFKNIIAGIVLGIPNYFSIYFLVKALRSDLFDSSGIFTINNVGIVIISTLLGIVFFKEQLSVKNWIGITLAVISIALVSLATL
ncbi:MAG: DMT family transporter [Ulvibacter sp.]|jgi:drug/metabolite transporter (DMT)-like permease|nr:DMT family transporter [Ulvibacter sp.]